MVKNSLAVNLFLNDFLYNSCSDWVDSLSSRPQLCLNAVAKSARLAWLYHPGRFADGALENWAFRYGNTRYLPESHIAVPEWAVPRSSATLHVASEIYPTGGHTRFIVKWIQRDVTSNHLLVLNRQSIAVPDFVERAIKEAGGDILCLPLSDSVSVRAAALRKLSLGFDRVILHHHPDDLVPVIAFSHSGGPPVAMFNHAHYSFSLGPSVADIIINTLDYFRLMSEQYRFARRTVCLACVPGGSRFSDEPIDKITAKSAIGIDSFSPVALAMADESYFRPAAGYDFFRTARKLLDFKSSLHLLIVGVRPDSPLIPFSLRGHSRCHFFGPVIDPISYYRAADVVLESFPMPSPGSLLETVVYGEAFPVPVYGASVNILRMELAPILRYKYRPRDEEDYVSYVGDLLSRLPEIRGPARQMRLLLVAYDQDWAKRIAGLNEQISQLKHEPMEIPRAKMIDTDDCRALADLRPMNIGAQINDTLPFLRAARVHFSAVRRGFSTPLALHYVGRLAWSSLRHSILHRREN